MARSTVNERQSMNIANHAIIVSYSEIIDDFQVTEKESTEYFQSRPRGSQVGAWALHQSRPVESRGSLESNVKDVQVHTHRHVVPLLQLYSSNCGVLFRNTF